MPDWIARSCSSHHSRFERPPLRHGEGPDRCRHPGRRGQWGCGPAPSDTLMAPHRTLSSYAGQEHYFLSTVWGDIPNVRLKLRLKWPRSLKPCAKAASVTERTSPRVRATRLASSRSDHTQRMGVAPSVLKRRFRLRTDIAPAAASASGLSSGSSRFARANRMTRSKGREVRTSGKPSRSRSQMEARRSTTAFDTLFAIDGPGS
jgi:hypothetical protein